MLVSPVFCGGCVRRCQGQDSSVPAYAARALRLPRVSSGVMAIRGFAALWCTCAPGLYGSTSSELPCDGRPRGALPRGQCLRTVIVGLASMRAVMPGVISVYGHVTVDVPR